MSIQDIEKSIIDSAVQVFPGLRQVFPVSDIDNKNLTEVIYWSLMQNGQEVTTAVVFNGQNEPVLMGNTSTLTPDVFKGLVGVLRSPEHSPASSFVQIAQGKAPLCPVGMPNNFDGVFVAGQSWFIGNVSEVVRSFNGNSFDFQRGAAASIVYANGVEMQRNIDAVNIARGVAAGKITDPDGALYSHLLKDIVLRPAVDASASANQFAAKNATAFSAKPPISGSGSNALMHVHHVTNAAISGFSFFSQNPELTSLLGKLEPVVVIGLALLAAKALEKDVNTFDIASENIAKTKIWFKKAKESVCKKINGYRNATDTKSWFRKALQVGMPARIPS